MSLNLANLDGPTRQFMLAELEDDVSQSRLYLSPRLSERGQAGWPSLLRAALQDGNDDSLANSLRSPGFFNPYETRATRSGGVTAVRIPVTAPEMLAEGEFNRFYIRRLCRRAIDEGVADLIVYRAKPVSNPRPESQARLGSRVAAEALLSDLREHPGVDTALGLPAGPNSGLTVRLP